MRKNVGWEESEEVCFEMLIHSYCTGTYTEVTVLHLWGSFAVTMEYPDSYSVRVPEWVLQGSIGVT